MDHPEEVVETLPAAMTTSIQQGENAIVEFEVRNSD